MASAVNAGHLRIFTSSLIFTCLALLTACASEDVQQGAKISLSGAQEAPPVSGSATGTGQITVLSDRSVSGSVTTASVAGTAAHIHEGAPGKVGPVIIPLMKTSEGTWTVPANAKLTESQYASYQAGNLYVNVHSAAYPGGEIRGQIIPPPPPRPATRYGY